MSTSTSTEAAGAAAPDVGVRYGLGAAWQLVFDHVAESAQVYYRGDRVPLAVVGPDVQALWLWVQAGDGGGPGWWMIDGDRNRSVWRRR